MNISIYFLIKYFNMIKKNYYSIILLLINHIKYNINTIKEINIFQILTSYGNFVISSGGG